MVELGPGSFIEWPWLAHAPRTPVQIVKNFSSFAEILSGAIILCQIGLTKPSEASNRTELTRSPPSTTLFETTLSLTGNGWRIIKFLPYYRNNIISFKFKHVALIKYTRHHKYQHLTGIMDINYRGI